ncbi:DUF5995 family protein [Mucilaginibacter gotjawali]|uniref:Uncharacterized protein n=2 Tax=Mucilaginibacter gotjawali TaxID=1550579 RepID=A0A839SID5_9SPHI|nr:DUF5995 family protein [Mucilaginibacter gotjawali]MBB3057228.1 hypothetical protein [Mucilaginibacter gotjawali]BAU53004.1 hypothetical protein MgSA37_01171 [Mucilaginibacter gotjawali]
MPALTIDDVLQQLATIIADSIRTNNRLGYFAALYYKVTAGVKAGIAKGQFENGPRMEKLDVIFASRYLDALNAWKTGQPVTASWKIAFDATKNSSLLVLQQLFLGMSAHINLDLGIAAVEVSNGQLDDIHNDFDNINTIISALTYEVLNEIDRVSPLLSLLGLHAGNQANILIQFSIDNARDGAWCFAEDLATKKTKADYDACIAARDETIFKLGGSLINNKGFIRFTIWLIHLFEWKNAALIIKTMHEGAKAKIVVE